MKIALPLIAASLMACGEPPKSIDTGATTALVPTTDTTSITSTTQTTETPQTTPLGGPPARLNFTDLISGPATGLDDGQGSGTIVTVWGQFLGDSQGNSTVSFVDADGNILPAAHVYYWKNADGQLPGGPANLFASHGMQEVAFSIPDAPDGAGEILLTVNGVASNALPFTVRAGGIFHVLSSGDDSTGDGSFASPWATVPAALSAMDDPGSTLYVHNSVVTDQEPHKAVYWNNSSASSGLDNQFGVVAYPDSQPTAVGYSGFRNYLTAGQVVSKFDVYASECDEDADGQPTNCASTPSLNLTYGIQTSAYGRAVGNAITDRPGGCADGTQAAISGNVLSGDRVSGYQILGNEVYDYGCPGSNKLHHTTYLSVRSGSDNVQVDPWRFGWNYLHDNHTKNGIHQYDENNSGDLCGSPNGTVRIHDNVVINQAGAGISIGANCPWTNNFEITNNLLIDVGRALDWDGIDPSTANGPNTSGISIQDGDLLGTIEIYNNTIHTWNDDDPANDTQACLGLQGSGDNVTILFHDNLCYTDKDKPFVADGCCGADVQLDNVTGTNNAWYTSFPSPVEAIKPAWDITNNTSDPQVSIVGAQVSVAVGSPLISESSAGLSHDLYGVPRAAQSEIGAVQAP